MAIRTQRFFLLVIGLLFCVFGCTRERGDVLMPDDISPPMEVHEDVDVEAAFEQNLLPILTARCALSGCHVADGPHGLDFRTYESFVAGGEHGPAFVPGNAQESEVFKQIALGTMPPGGPPLSLAEIQLFVDWINQQESHGDIVPHDDAHGAEEDGHDDMNENEHDEDMHDDDAHGAEEAEEDVHDDVNEGDHDEDMDDAHGAEEDAHDAMNEDEHDDHNDADDN